jgi:hypothetical protein
MLAEAVQLINHGKTAVHLTGYQTTTDVMDDGMMMSDDDQDLEDGLPARRVPPPPPPFPPTTTCKVQTVELDCSCGFEVRVE